MNCKLALLSLFALALPVSAQGTNGAAKSPLSVDDILDIVTVRSSGMTEDGRWLVITESTSRDRIGIDNYRNGDPTYIRPSQALVSIVDTATGSKTPLFRHKVQAQGFSWSPDGSLLAFMLRVGNRFELRVWERETGQVQSPAPPPDRVVAHNASLQWLPDSSGLVLALRTSSWSREAKASFDALTAGPIVVFSSESPFLEWDSVRRLSMRQILAVCDLYTGEFRELLPEIDLRSYQLSTDGSIVRYQEDITEKTNYDISGNNSTVSVLPVAGGEPRTIIESTRQTQARWAPDGRHYAIAKNGDLYFASVDDEEPRRLTGSDDEPTGEEETEEEDRERFSINRLSSDAAQMIASSNKGLYLIDTATGERKLFLERDPDDDRAPRYSVNAWSTDGQHIFLSRSSPSIWSRGFAVYDVAQGSLRDLILDDRLYGSFQLSDNGSTVVFAASEGNRTNDLYVTDPGFDNVRRLTTANPFLANRSLSDTELITYLDVDGNELYGVIYYPTEYVPSVRYPTIFLVYERFFDNRFNAGINHLTSRGYAVVQPSVQFEQGYPGEAWLKGVTAAANKVIDMGLADPDRLGVHGTSYGGYATNLLIAQTKRFKAAINISGKVNMVSFYTDSPRIGTRNIRAPERGQDRIGATLWEQPQKYIATSAIMDADRITTPLLLLTGEQDHNVPGRQAMEMFYALRRLGQTVEWVNYINGGHGTPTSEVGEVHDYYQRILGWYDKYLKGDEAEAVVLSPQNGNRRDG